MRGKDFAYHLHVIFGQIGVAGAFRNGRNSMASKEPRGVAIGASSRLVPSAIRPLLPFDNGARGIGDRSSLDIDRKILRLRRYRSPILSPPRRRDGPAASYSTLMAERARGDGIPPSSSPSRGDGYQARGPRTIPASSTATGTSPANGIISGCQFRAELTLSWKCHVSQRELPSVFTSLPIHTESRHTFHDSCSEGKTAAYSAAFSQKVSNERNMRIAMGHLRQIGAEQPDPFMFQQPSLFPISAVRSTSLARNSQTASEDLTSGSNACESSNVPSKEAIKMNVLDWRTVALEFSQNERFRLASTIHLSETKIDPLGMESDSAARECPSGEAGRPGAKTIREGAEWRTEEKEEEEDAIVLHQSSGMPCRNYVIPRNEKSNERYGNSAAANIFRSCFPHRKRVRLESGAAATGRIINRKGDSEAGIT